MHLVVLSVLIRITCVSDKDESVACDASVNENPRSVANTSIMTDHHANFPFVLCIPTESQTGLFGFPGIFVISMKTFFCVVAVDDSHHLIAPIC